ncbi:spermatid nuclear transition protein 1 isoform X2 [Monodelphis domestica]|nr:spermatid nuclear transition protein 1 isoform X2 [Monodelphis domestica]
MGPHPVAQSRPLHLIMAKGLNRQAPGLRLFKAPRLAASNMSTNRRMKSKGGRRNKSRAPHKGVKRAGSKRKYRKTGLKSRKRSDEAHRTYRSNL